MIDAHTTARRAWLKSLQPRTPFIRRHGENLKNALLLAVLLLAFGIVGRMDYEDALATEVALNAERDAYTMALSHCINGDQK
jgi:hypothetical protein